MKLLPAWLMCLLLCTFDAQALTVSHAGDGLAFMPLMSPHTTVALLYDNLISNIEGEELAAYSILETLDLSNNLLTQFPNATAVASTLKKLFLNNNLIRFIQPDHLDSLQALEWLEVNYNLLETIPDVAGPGNTLQILKLDNNFFSAFPRMSKLGKMISTIHLRNNQIRSIHPVQLAGLGINDAVYSVGLWLSANQLEELPDITPLNNTLGVLHLEDNNIKRIDWRYLTQTTYHTDMFGIYFDRNNISELEMPCGELPTGLRISLVMNPLNCDCKLQWLKKGWTGGGDFSLSLRPCASPPTLSGQDWETDIRLEDMTCRGQ